MHPPEKSRGCVRMCLKCICLTIAFLLAVILVAVANVLFSQ